jgi:hypothetical protein
MPAATRMFFMSVEDRFLGARFILKSHSFFFDLLRVESLSYLPKYAFQLNQAIHLSGQGPPNQPADTEGDGSGSQTKQYLPYT